MNEQEILTPLSKSEVEALIEFKPTNIPYERLNFESLTQDSLNEEIPESAFYYGEESETVVEQPPVKREVNWSFLFAWLFGMTTLALVIHVIGK